MGDWLGTGTIAYFQREYQPFRKARAFARTLGLKSVAEWYSYCKSGGNPDDIPKTPWQVYAEDGWAGMKDWLGTESVSSRQRLEESVPVELQIEIPD